MRGMKSLAFWLHPFICFLILEKDIVKLEVLLLQVWKLVDLRYLNFAMSMANLLL
jgi:hypothetical protein